MKKVVQAEHAACLSREGQIIGKLRELVNNLISLLRTFYQKNHLNKVDFHKKAILYTFAPDGIPLINLIYLNSALTSFQLEFNLILVCVYRRIILFVFKIPFCHFEMKRV